jgi:hypothetical protein
MEAGNQPYAVAVAFYAEAVSVIVDFVNPLGARGHDLADGGDAELELGHGSEIGSRRHFWSQTA